MTDVICNASIRSLQELGISSIDISAKVFKFPKHCNDDDINNTKMIIIDNRHAHVMTANLDGSHFEYHSFVSFNCVNRNFTKSLAAVFERDWTSIYARDINSVDAPRLRP